MDEINCGYKGGGEACPLSSGGGVWEWARGNSITVHLYTILRLTGCGVEVLNTKVWGAKNQGSAPLRPLTLTTAHSLHWLLICYYVILQMSLEAAGYYGVEVRLLL